MQAQMFFVMFGVMFVMFGECSVPEEHYAFVAIRDNTYEAVGRSAYQFIVFCILNYSRSITVTR